MNVIETSLSGVLLIEPRVFGDERGFFFESFNARSFAQATGVDLPFVQDNHSHSRHGVLRAHLKPGHCAIGSINSPMQCMMKEICAQCLQPHRDPVTGETSWVFSCFNQDQPLDRVDWAGLNARLGQNSLSEKLTAQWIGRALDRSGLRDTAV